MDTTIPRRRRARAFSLAAAIALVALLLPATAGVVLGHHAVVQASLACDGTVAFTLSDWTNVDTNGQAEATFEVYYQVNGSGPYQDLHQSIAFTASNYQTAYSSGLPGAPFNVGTASSVTIEAVLTTNWSDQTTDSTGPWYSTPALRPTECGSPTIGTAQQPASATVGSSIADKATVSGGNNPTGTVTFTLYRSSGDCVEGQGTPLLTDTEALVSGTATSKGYIASATGIDYWLATYNGDDNNASVSSGCADEPVTINRADPEINTSQLPATAVVGTSIADEATVSGGYNPSGTVTFKLYSNSAGTGTPFFTDTETLSGGTATSAGYVATAAGTDYWVATYNGDANNNPATSATASEPVVVTPPTSPPCTAANNCYFNTPTPPVVTPTPTPTPTTTPTTTPTPTPTSTVEAATSRPHMTPPPTSSTGGPTGGPASGTWLVLLAVAGLLGSILLLTPVPARARRKR